MIDTLSIIDYQFLIVDPKTSTVAGFGSSNFENFGLQEAAIPGSKCKGTLDGSDLSH